MAHKLQLVRVLPFAEAGSVFSCVCPPVVEFHRLAVGEGAAFGFGGPKPPTQPVVIPTLQPPQPGFSFPSKQTLTFTVDWRVFTAGTAVFQLEQQGTVQKITATADTVAQ